MARTTGSYLIRVGVEWALVSRLNPSYEIPFASRKCAIRYARQLGWPVSRFPVWDRLTPSDVDVLDLDGKSLTDDERKQVRRNLDSVRKLRKARKFLAPFGLKKFVNKLIKKTLKKHGN
jgi:hypothetical protein